MSRKHCRIKNDGGAGDLQLLSSRSLLSPTSTFLDRKREHDNRRANKTNQRPSITRIRFSLTWERKVGPILCAREMEKDVSNLALLAVISGLIRLSSPLFAGQLMS